MYTPAFKQYVFQDKLSVRQPDRYRIVSSQIDLEERQGLEQFIYQGFASCYGASVQSFMPHLLGFKDSNQTGEPHKSTYRAAMGIRLGHETLFVEQYLNDSLDSLLAGHGIQAQRNQVAEIGNLYSASKRHTLPLLRLGLLVLSSLNIQYAAFTATCHVKTLLTRQSVNFIYLSDANPEALTNKSENWGSYYQTSPQVLVINVAETLLNTTVNTDIRQPLNTSLKPPMQHQQQNAEGLIYA